MQHVTRIPILIRLISYLDLASTYTGSDITYQGWEHA
jgi:hypothetical protein